MNTPVHAPSLNRAAVAAYAAWDRKAGQAGKTMVAGYSLGRVVRLSDPVEELVRAAYADLLEGAQLVREYAAAQAAAQE